MRTARIGVQIVRIDVERDERQSGERRRIHNGHIVGRVDRPGGHVRSGTAAHVGQIAGQHAPSNRLD